jgi:hypothetical protein
MAEDNSDKVVRNPHDHDVLLGRGGLSNNHPGNNWYRRLVRSNKGLYDQAQKHTKLLVAKAIVHHVEAQDPPGRFLEKDKSTGLWVPASYEKAVHKTSQALRERKLLENEVNVQVRQTLHSLSIPIAPVEAGMTSQQAATVTPPTAGVAPVNEKFDSTKPPALQQTASWFWRNQKKPKTASSSLSEIPPPTAPVRQQSSSLLQFFAKSLPRTTSNTMDYDSNTINDDLMMHGGLDQSMEPQPFAPAGAPFLGTSPFMESVSLDNSHHQNMFDHDGTRSHSIEPLPLSNDIHNTKKRSRDAFEPSPLPEAPTLTKLTTQVSDWLLSLFPIGEDSNCREGDAKEQQQQPMQVPEPVSHHPQRPQKQTLQQQQRQQEEQQNAHQTAAPAPSSQASASPDLQLQLSVVAESVANLKQQMETTTIGASTAATIHQIQLQLEQMHAAIASSTTPTNGNAAMTSTPSNVGLEPPPPTTLQPSVTSALWNLANTPSRLFGGLSSIFSDSAIAPFGEDNNGGGGEMGGSLDAIGCQDVHSGGITSSDITKSNLNGTAEDVGHGPLNPNIHQPPLENKDSASLMPPPPLDMAQFGWNKNNHVESFNGMSEIVDSNHDPRFGRKASGSLLDDLDDADDLNVSIFRHGVE